MFSISFYAKSFVFDGVPCEQYGLTLYNLEGTAQGTGAMGGSIAVSTGRIARRSGSLYYGDTQNEPLRFTLVFGVMDGWLDRYDQAAVAGWLLRRGGYRWLTICQPDMLDLRFRCLVTSLTPVEVGMLPRAFAATIECDAPFAHHIAAPVTTAGTAAGAAFVYHNGSNVDAPYCPRLVFDLPAGTEAVSLYNAADGRTFSLTGLDGAARTITVDCCNQVLTASDACALYDKCNLCFPQFVRGANALTLTGVCTLTLPREWYVNAGF